MKTGMRSFLVIAGLSLLYAAALLLIAKPFSSPASAVPLIPFSQNLPYFLYVRAAQALLGLHAGAVMFANALILGLTALGVFRLGWRLADPRHRLASGAAAMLLFVMTPLSLVLPLTLGFHGEVLLAPFFLVMFFNVLLWVENWSAFMRAIVLGIAWSCFFWVHVPTALIVLAAFIPWMLYSRRPAAASGVFAAICSIGMGLFFILWTLAWALGRRWTEIQNPWERLKAVFASLQQAAAWDGLAALHERLIHTTAWLSPFLGVWGLWICGRAIRGLMQERRAGVVHIAVMVSLMVLAIVLATPAKDVLPGAWYLLLILAIWTPLAAQDIAKKENFYSRGFRFTCAAAAAVCAGILWALQRSLPQGSLLPDGQMLVALSAACASAGVLFYGVLKRFSLPLENRVQAFLAGSTVAYFGVMAVQFFQ
jgi:hypothetical protein